VRVTLTAAPDAVTLVVEDDGRGFDPAQAPAHRYGLRGMNERANLLGGVLTVESAANAGARITVRAPLPAAQAGRP
jgi:signal transduction histidine kinase